MPPKKSVQAASKKKAVEDKTFGLKNKNKSAKVKSFVNMVQKQSDEGGRPKKGAEDPMDHKARTAERRRMEDMKKQEDKELFKTAAAVQKVPFGVDPKTVLCSFFKINSCQKGTRCKFSHDLNIGRKDQKIDLYTDSRDEEKTNDTMETWDLDKLREVVAGKDEKKNQNTPTEIVCKFFLDAVESRKYGWFWACPTGVSCKYRHALPPGYVLKMKETEEEKREREEKEKENEITIEDFLETERHKLKHPLTPITNETFAQWKAERKARQREEEEAEIKKKSDGILKPGKAGLSFSGKELFDFNPDWADAGDEDAMEFYEREDSEDEEESNVVKASGSASAGVSWEVINVAEDLFEDDLDGLDDED